MDSPKVIYEINDSQLKDIFRFEDFIISSDSDSPSKGWYSLATKEFKAIHWTINASDRYYYNRPGPRKEGLFCNGFKIIRGFEIPGYPWKKPIVSVFDGNAKMPLSLSRDYLLNDRLPFEDELVSHICYKVIEKLLKTEFHKVNQYWVPKPNILELSQTKVDLSKFIVVKEEPYTLITPFVFKALGIKLFYQLWLKQNQKEKILFNNGETFYQAFSLKNDSNYLYRNLLDPKSYGRNYLKEWFALGDIKRRNDLLTNNYILNDKLAYMKEKNRLTKTFRSSHKSSLYNDRWAVIKNYRHADDDYGRKPDRKKKVEKAIKELKEDSRLIKNNLNNTSFYYVKENYLSVDEFYSFTKFKEVWESVYGQDNYLIPIDKKFRRELGGLKA